MPRMQTIDARRRVPRCSKQALRMQLRELREGARQKDLGLQHALIVALERCGISKSVSMSRTSTATMQASGLYFWSTEGDQRDQRWKEIDEHCCRLGKVTTVNLRGNWYTVQVHGLVYGVR